MQFISALTLLAHGTYTLGSDVALGFFTQHGHVYSRCVWSCICAQFLTEFPPKDTTEFVAPVASAEASSQRRSPRVTSPGLDTAHSNDTFVPPLIEDENYEPFNTPPRLAQMRTTDDDAVGFEPDTTHLPPLPEPPEGRRQYYGAEPASMTPMSTSAALAILRDSPVDIGASNRPLEPLGLWPIGYPSPHRPTARALHQPFPERASAQPYSNDIPPVQRYRPPVQNPPQPIPTNYHDTSGYYHTPMVSVGTAHENRSDVMSSSRWTSTTAAYMQPLIPIPETPSTSSGGQPLPFSGSTTSEIGFNTHNASDDEADILSSRGSLVSNLGTSPLVSAGETVPLDQHKSQHISRDSDNTSNDSSTSGSGGTSDDPQSPFIIYTQMPPSDSPPGPPITSYVPPPIFSFSPESQQVHIASELNSPQAGSRAQPTLFGHSPFSGMPPSQPPPRLYPQAEVYGPSPGSWSLPPPASTPWVRPLPMPRAFPPPPPAPSGAPAPTVADAEQAVEFPVAVNLSPMRARPFGGHQRRRRPVHAAPS